MAGDTCPCAELLAREKLAQLRGPIVPVRLTSTSADQKLLGPEVGLELVGWSLTENNAAVARIRILEGTLGANDLEHYDVTLAANESAREWFATGPEGAGIPIRGGLSVGLTSGTVKGTFFVRRRREPSVA